jgi:hypothetical protein
LPVVQATPVVAGQPDLPILPFPHREEAAPAPVVPPALDPQRVYSPEDGDVTPPVAIGHVSAHQAPSHSNVSAITVVVDEHGRVQSAVLVRWPGSFQETVIATLNLSAAKAWRFEPALRNGRPVKYRTTIWVVRP